MREEGLFDVQQGIFYHIDSAIVAKLSAVGATYPQKVRKHVQQQCDGALWHAYTI